MQDDLNTALADEIQIGSQETGKTSQSGATNDAESQETEGNRETPKENGEGTAQQAEDAAKEGKQQSEANTGEPKEPGEQSTGEPEGGEAEGETATKEETKPDAEAILKEISNGQIESTDQLTGMLEENQRLKEELKKPREPEFASERAKQAYEYLQNHSGNFEDLTREQHRVLSLDTEGMDDKELQFEAFALKRKDLNRAEARQVFNLKHGKLFEELEDDPDNLLLKDELKVNSIEAKADIKKAQETLQSELAPKEAGDKTNQSQGDQEESLILTPEQKEELRNNVNHVLNGFNQLQVNLGKEGKEVVNIALNEGQLEALNDAMNHPGDLLDAALAQFLKPDKSYDYTAYRNFITRFIHHDRIVQESFNQGINTGKRMALENAKNLETKEPVPKADSKEEPTFIDAWAGAMKKGNN